MRIRDSAGAEPERAPLVFDRVLVDAECTHDASWRHAAKADADADGARDAAAARVAAALGAERRASLPELQRGLLAAGFARCRDGGVVVYSTCSAREEQNEEVVRAFLAATPAARVLPLGPEAAAWPCEPGALEGSLRFPPALGTGGMFLVRLGKASAPRENGAG